MRRIVLWLLSTVAAVVVLFSYRTSTMGTGAAASTGPSAVPSIAGGTTFQGSLAQTRWGIKPYSAFLGALKLADEVAIEVDAPLEPA